MRSRESPKTWVDFVQNARMTIMNNRSNSEKKALNRACVTLPAMKSLKHVLPGAGFQTFTCGRPQGFLKLHTIHFESCSVLRAAYVEELN